MWLFRRRGKNLSPAELDAVFDDYRERQYRDTLLFSSVVGIPRLVVTKMQPSLHAAYKAGANNWASRGGAVSKDRPHRTVGAGQRQCAVSRLPFT